jgi:hypothetical protein
MKNFAGIILLLCVAIGCKLPNIGTQTNSSTASNASGTGTATASSSNGTFTSTGDPIADLKEISKRFTEVKAFQAQTRGSGEKPFNMDAGFVAPDRYRIQTGAMESIIIGKDVYTKVGGTWRKFPMSTNQSIPTLRDMFTEEGLKSMTDARFNGDATLDGKDALLYSYKGAGVKGVSSYDSKLWISKSSGLPMKVEVNYDTGQLKQATITYTYDENATIEAPIK